MAGKAGGKGKKHKRNSDWCKAYKGRDQRGKNKKVKLLRHVRKTGRNDTSAWAALNAMKVTRESLGL